MLNSRIILKESGDDGVKVVGGQPSSGGGQGGGHTLLQVDHLAKVKG